MNTNDELKSAARTADLSVLPDVHAMVRGEFREVPIEWWGATSKDLDTDDLGIRTERPSCEVGPLEPLRSRKLSVPNRDGTKTRHEVTVTRDEYLYETVPKRRKRKSQAATLEPFVPMTDVPELIAWLDESGIEPAKEFSWVRVPLSAPGAVTWERVRDISTAQQVRRLRKPPDDDSDQGERCISAPFGCTNPVEYRDPNACRPCKHYFYDNDGQWPDADIIDKRTRRAERRAQATRN